MKKVILISNPLSGSYSNKKINRIIRTLKENDFEIIEYKLKKGQNVKEIIDTIDYDEISIILLAFGDGTINSACNAIIDRGDYKNCKIGIIPIGTANIFAAELNITSIKKSLRAIIKGNIKPVHFGKISSGKYERYFSLMISSGFDSVVVKNINENLKAKIGKFVYIWELLKFTIKGKSEILTTTVDKTFTCDNVLTCVSNGKYYGLRFPITNSDIDKNIFEVFIVKSRNIFSIIKYVFLKKSNNIVTLKGNNVEISSKNIDYPVQIDGDCHCSLPVIVENSNVYLNLFYNITL
jgi:YegS/Rv2252/BmrU family lipid kinase